MNLAFPDSVIEDCSYDIASTKFADSTPRDIRAIQALFCAVVLQAFADVAGLIPTVEDPGLRKRQASHWLLQGGRDFAFVCSLAGVSPEVIRRAALDIEAGRRQFLHKPKGRKPHSFRC